MMSLKAEPKSLQAAWTLFMLLATVHDLVLSPIQWCVVFLASMDTVNKEG